MTVSPDSNEPSESPRRRLQGGVALILVIFIVALATILVTNLVYSTHLAARQSSMIERGFQAEYLLKSGINLARTLIKLNQGQANSEKDLWGVFKNGMAIPPEYLNLSDPTIKIELEIRPEESKIPLRALVPVPSNNTVSTVWRDALLRLFQNLQLDNDKEKDQTPLFAGRVFSSTEMVANLIDFVDANDTPYSDGNFKGIENQQTDDYFLNQQITRFGQLASVPGFTPGRLAKLQLFLTTYVISQTVNINVASKAVLEALDPEIDEGTADRLIAYIKSDKGPLQNRDDLEAAGLSKNIADNLLGLIRYDSKWYQVIAKVDYDTSSFFARAYLEQKQKGDYPDIASFELF